MTTEWKDCTAPEELFRRKREGWEIEVRAHKTYAWRTWAGGAWDSDWLFRCRPRQPKTKTITLRKALMKHGVNRYTNESDSDMSRCAGFVCWIGEPYTVEVPE